eukprot:13039782-Alexandrium_andersonii.AAC.1
MHFASQEAWEDASSLKGGQSRAKQTEMINTLITRKGGSLIFDTKTPYYSELCKHTESKWMKDYHSGT